MFKTWDRMNMPGLCSTKKFVVCRYRWRLRPIQYMSRTTRHSLGLKHLLYSSHIPSHLSIVSFPPFCFSSHTSFHVLRRGSHYTSKPSLMLPPQEILSSVLHLSLTLIPHKQPCLLAADSNMEVICCYTRNFNGTANYARLSRSEELLLSLTEWHAFYTWICSITSLCVLILEDMS